MIKSESGSAQIDGAIVLARLKANHKARTITRNQYRTLRGQVISGNPAGAMKGLNTILRRQSKSVGKSGEAVENE